MTRSALSLDLVKPLAERLREQAPLCDPAQPDWQQIEAITASTSELAAIWRADYDTARMRVERRFGEPDQMQVPSRKHRGKNELRIYVSALTRSEQRAIRRLRREMAQCSIVAHPGGLVLREDDKRLALSQEERKCIQGMYCQRHEPSIGHLMTRLAMSCVRCHSSRMTQVVPGAKGRYGAFRCANSGCAFEFSYRTIVRVCNAVLPEATTHSRKGLNAWTNRHDVYRPQPANQFHRNERVYADHHVLDLWCWDESDASRKLRRGLWLSAWQDKSSGVFEFRIGWKANSDLLSLAFRSYVLRYGLPEEAWMDNGRDYLSAQFSSLCAELGVAVHHTLPSKRAGESHGKSKPIERLFGTLERDLVRALPGWCGTHPKERPDDALWPMQKKHDKFAAREAAETDFLSCQQIEVRVRAWTEQHFLVTPSATADAAPMAAFTADSHPVKTVGTGAFGERALDILLWRAKTRQIGRNGVSVDGRMYWSSEFACLSGLECQVRWDPGNLGEVVVRVEMPKSGNVGARDRVIIATSAAWTDLAESNYERFREIKKQRRTAVKDYLDIRHRAAAGISEYDEMLLEAQAQEKPEAQRAVVNGNPIITEGHRLANAIDRAEARNSLGVHGARGNPATASSKAGLMKHAPRPSGQPLKLMPDYEEEAPRRRLFSSEIERDFYEKPEPALREPWQREYGGEGDNEPPIDTIGDQVRAWAENDEKLSSERPVFTNAWEREEWEREHPDDKSGRTK